MRELSACQNSRHYVKHRRGPLPRGPGSCPGSESSSITGFSHHGLRLLLLSGGHADWGQQCSWEWEQPARRAQGHQHSSRQRERAPLLPPPAHGLEMQSVVPRGMAEDPHALIQARRPPPAHGQGSAECPGQLHFYIPSEQAFFLTTESDDILKTTAFI